MIQLKKTMLGVLSIFTLLTTSCDKDDIQDNALPETTADSKAQDLFDNIKPIGAIKIEGDIPQKKGAIDFKFTDDDQKIDSYINSNFKLKFYPPKNYAGAYVKIKDSDGSISSAYWNIPNLGLKNSKMAKKNSIDTIAPVEIVFDFTTVEAGKFCVDVSTYDTDGNITEEKEKCITVHAWAGNNYLKGNTYNYIQDKSSAVINYAFALSVDGEINKEKCFDVPFECDDQLTVFGTKQKLTADDSNCVTKNKLQIQFNEDGTFIYINESTSTLLNFEESKKTCSIIMQPESVNKVIARGKWSSHSSQYLDLKKIVLMQFEMETYQNGIALTEEPIVSEEGFQFMTMYFSENVRDSWNNSDNIVLTHYNEENDKFIHWTMEQEK